MGCVTCFPKIFVVVACDKDFFAYTFPHTGEVGPFVSHDRIPQPPHFVVRCDNRVVSGDDVCVHGVNVWFACHVKVGASAVADNVSVPEMLIAGKPSQLCQPFFLNILSALGVFLLRERRTVIIPYGSTSCLIGVGGKFQRKKS